MEVVTRVELEPPEEQVVAVWEVAVEEPLELELLITVQEEEGLVTFTIIRLQRLEDQVL